MSSKEQKVRQIVDLYFESEYLRSLVILFLLKSDYLTKRAQSIASMGVSRLVKNNVPLPWEPDFENYSPQFKTKTLEVNLK